MPTDASTTAAWPRLKADASRQLPSIAELFATDPVRSGACIVRGAGLTLDFSRQRASAGTLQLLAQLADELALRERIAGMYRGDIANPTEGRQVLHTALRRAGARMRAKFTVNASTCWDSPTRCATVTCAAATGSVSSS